jgi:hypothetical protein
VPSGRGDSPRPTIFLYSLRETKQGSRKVLAAVQMRFFLKALQLFMLSNSYGTSLNISVYTLKFINSDLRLTLSFSRNAFTVEWKLNFISCILHSPVVLQVFVLRTRSDNVRVCIFHLLTIWSTKCPKKNYGVLGDCTSKYTRGSTLIFLPLKQCPGRPPQVHTSEFSFVWSFGATWWGLSGKV